MILLAFIAGIAVGFLIIRCLIILKMKRMLDSIANSPIPDKKIVNINFVKMDHAILVYNRETQQFLAQGNSKEEIVQLLAKRFPDTSFMANSRNIEEAGLK
jgi:hypothetical protein